MTKRGKKDDAAVDALPDDAAGTFFLQGMSAANVSATSKAESLAPEEIILDAACAFDALSRRAVMHNRSGLTKAQTDIVMALALFGAASMTELAHNLAVSKEHITRAVNALCESGLVEKRRSTENFRNVEAQLTEAGRAVSTTIRLASIDRLRERLSSLSEAEREELIELARRTTELLRKVRQS